MASTFSPVHVIARIQGETGTEVTVGADCDGVVIHAAGNVVLGHGAREEFSRAYSEAVRQAGAWAERYGGRDG
jgi:hypothetical protein